MAPRVAVPEKTLEHWASQYITYRFRSKAALWWPACGEDVEFDHFPARPGKAIQLELKTATPSGGHQDVKVDLGQLWEYCQRPLGQQPFYVFPKPDWTGNLADRCRQHGRMVTELGVARSGNGWWFADWLVVMTTAEVAEVLAGALRDHGTSARGRSARLVRFTPAAPTHVQWGVDGRADPASPLAWRDFWDRIVSCGERSWPQLLRIPRSAIGDDRHVRHGRLADVLRHRASTLTGDDELVTFVPGGDGRYHAIESSVEEELVADAEDESTPVESEDRRVAVFLDGSALV